MLFIHRRVDTSYYVTRSSENACALLVALECIYPVEFCCLSFHS